MDTNKKSVRLLNQGVKTALLLCVSFSTLNTVSASSNELAWQSAYKNYQTGNFSECYQSLQKLDYLLGEVTYDKLLGLCAQRIGKNDQALLAYNRIIAQQANNAEIRLERAKTLFDLNMNSEARAEFNWLKDRNPPQSAANVIDDYLKAITFKTIKIKPYTRLRISTSIGQDDNVNSATELDNFLGFALNENSRATSSQYYGLGLTVARNIKLSNDSGLKLSTSLSNKTYPDAEFVDQDLVLGGISYQKHFSDGVMDIDLLAYRQKVDSEFNSRGGLAFNSQLSDKVSIKPYVRASALRYTDNVSIRDVNQYAAGASLNHLPSNVIRLTWDLSIGHDYPLFADSNYEADFAIANFRYQHKFSPTLSSMAELEYKRYAYERAFFSGSFPENRTDNTLSAAVSLNWNLAKNLNLTPKFAFRDATSNVDLFSYERWYAEISANYLWAW